MVYLGFKKIIGWPLKQQLLRTLIVFIGFEVIMSTSVLFVTSMADSLKALSPMQVYLQTHPTVISAIQSTHNLVITARPPLQLGLNTQLLAQVVRHSEPEHALLPKIFPVYSPSLTPGQVPSRAVQAMLPHPIFIVGDDTRSKSWLQHHQSRLVQLKATGFVVNVDSEKALLVLRQSYPRLILLAVPVDSIAKILAIHHYPVLISDQRIEQ